MRFGVIGEPCVDYVHLPGKETVKCLGGVLYSVASLAILSSGQAEVYPIMYLGRDEYDNITRFLRKFDNIRGDFVVGSDMETRVVNLYYKSVSDAGICRNDRHETSTRQQPPIEDSIIEKALLRLDALLINMVSGKDITLDTLRKIRNNFTGCIHIDLHNVVMRNEPEGGRIQQRVEEWEEWCRNSDTVQANEREFQIMSGIENQEEIAERILYGDAIDRASAVVITRGRMGAALFRRGYKEGAKERYYGIERMDIPAIENPKFKDSTGCGDVFASAFLYKYAMTRAKDYVKALRFANRIASMKTGLVGVEELSKLQGSEDARE